MLNWLKNNSRKVVLAAAVAVGLLAPPWTIGAKIASAVATWIEATDAQQAQQAAPAQTPTPAP